MRDSIPKQKPSEIVFGDSPMSINDVQSIARCESIPVLSEDSRDRMNASAELVSQLLERGNPIYGVTTGVGASVDRLVADGLGAEFSTNLFRMHGCGTGRFFDSETTSAIIAVRLSSLARGVSGVRASVVDSMIQLLVHGITPRIPEEGSVGASGDLTPLSYLAAVMAGERDVLFRGEVLDAAIAFEKAGISPLTYGPKEALALMNGTSVTTALSCLGWVRALRLARVASSLTAMVSEAIQGNPEHFDEDLHRVKPHPGQMRVAKWIREDLGPHREQKPKRLQDRYSIRCAPQVIGVLVDVLSWTKTIIETELNGTSDNPVIIVDREAALHGGHFYGSHIGFALDMLKVAVANVADLIDRQLMLICHPDENGGLPANLAGVHDESGSTHHGFKAMSIAASAMAAEALKMSSPASAFSRSTESHNQDKVPMATLAGREFIRCLELSEQTVSIFLLATTQALGLKGGFPHGKGVRAIYEAVREHVPPLVEDRAMDRDIALVLSLLREDAIPLGDRDIS